ncbi:MAG: hypothetical protein RJA63_2343 [Pseudomonadota bacterium]|jgi:farnesyl-diphosphate farnesyltransferase
MNAEDHARFGIDLSRDTCNDPWAFSSEMLQRVSRTFALNIRVLPKTRLRQPILLAYLFCRMADTVEDCPTLPAARKKTLLALFAAIFSGGATSWREATAAFTASLPESWQASEDDEEFLCAHCGWCLQLYFALDESVRGPIAQCVVEMCDGMARFALRQAQANGEWLSIADEADLDRYCYFVAGVVGNMLSDLFCAQSPFINAARHAKMRERAVSFGLALQLVNIIKDAGEDRSREVCFIPMAWMREAGFAHPRDFFALSAKQTERLDVMQRMIAKAWRHLHDARDYILLIPALEPRMRLFCQWPMLMAAETLVAIGDGSALFDSAQPVKIGRDAVKRIVRQTSLRAWHSAWFKRRFAFLAKRGTRKCDGARLDAT